MKVVIDTNVVFSALYRADSHPGKLILLAIDGVLELFAPDTVRGELERVLRKKLGYSDSDWRATLEALPITWIERPEYEDLLPEASAAISDGSDAPVVATALLLGAGIVSGDRDYHPLKRPLVPTWRPREAAESSVRGHEKRRPRRRGSRPRGRR